MASIAYAHPPTCSPVSGGAGPRALREAAERYAARGWRVLPGPVSDGIATRHPVTFKPLRSWEAAADVSAATAEPRRIREWWSRHAHTILAQTGRQFDVLRTPTLLGWQAMAAFGGGHPLGPVATSPQGVFFFVKAGSSLKRELGNVAGVELVQAGTLVALPPSRAVSGAVSWRIQPEDIEDLGDCDEIQDKLAELAADR
ncbi:bifunctional DNA primase/polymerase [Amycolatopsis rubida]|uniref:Bifunctional DNA primase/polymerase, N-terminal n=1 Tax=Amycolatopsis rubida TaxID=112413 RepID=A0A1I5X7V0_9PSEU|nr:bifunctional DNA primase/polymerase [Amycolatopsis rubida]SFQ27727.1 Bifunctional DNA primase/polymerase, N-terminal [Amycolatopsis rubida]